MTLTLEDPVALRTVFAAPDEKLVVTLAEPGQSESLARVSEAVDTLRRSGSRVKLVVCGDTRAALAGDRLEVGFLESWAHSLFPALLGVADAVVPLGEWTPSMKGGVDGPRLVTDPARLRAALSETGTRTSRRFVLQNDWGIGDELLLSAVAREIVRAYPNTEIWIRSRHGFRFPSYVRAGLPAPDARVVETIYQNATLYGPGHHSPFPGHLVQQMLDKFTLDTGLKVKAVDVRPELDILRPRRTGDPTVVLHSGTNPRLPSKDWGLGRWKDLAGILTARGVRLRQVGSLGEPTIPGAEDLRGTPSRDLPELFSESWAAVSVVGFLMHLAEAARTPAVVIYGGREHPAIDGYPDQIHLSSGPLACRGRWGCHLGPDLECPHAMKCMEHLSPEIVAGKVLGLLEAGAPA